MKVDCRESRRCYCCGVEGKRERFRKNTRKKLFMICCRFDCFFPICFTLGWMLGFIMPTLKSCSSLQCVIFSALIGVIRKTKDRKGIYWPKMLLVTVDLSHFAFVLVSNVSLDRVAVDCPCSSCKREKRFPVSSVIYSSEKTWSVLKRLLCKCRCRIAESIRKNSG